MTSLLSVEDLVVDFETTQGRLRAVDGVSFEVAAGESVGIVGESGSGKSTLGRAILALVRPTAGRIRFDGADLSELRAQDLRRRRQALQIVFQHPGPSFDPRRTIVDSVAEPLAVHEPALDRAARERRASAMLERVGVDAALGARRPHELSGGQCQRAAIARAMITRPRLVVCDEPVSALDVSVQGQVLNLLADLRREHGTSYLFISHNLAVVRHVASRVLVLYRGRVVESAPREVLYGAARHPYTQLLLDSVPGAASAAARRAAAAVPPETASPFARPRGCGFAGRCPLVERRCEAAPPPLAAVAEGHAVACVRADEAARP